MQLPPSATLADSQALLSLLGKVFADRNQASEEVKVDASALQHFDTATIALLMQAKRLAQEAGRTFSVHGVPDKLLELAQLYGVEELLSLPSAAGSASASATRPAARAEASTASGPGDTAA